MRSRNAERFNHDEEAPGYDADVRDEADPIRAGYDAVLAWVAERARCDPTSRVLDLGSGTGNLSQRLSAWRELVCVDVSREMTRLAREKLGARPGVSFVHADLLEFFDTPGPAFDAVVSTYAVHHLDATEKPVLFERIRERLAPDGRVAFGDLMFEDAAARDALLAGYRACGRGELADDIEDEFFWDLSEAVAHLEALGFEVEKRRFSELGFGIAGALR